MSHWTFDNKKFDPTEDELIASGHYGFVYNITLPNGQMYIGRKYFWSIRTLKPLKGKKRKRKQKKESNWRIYKSSSNDVVEMIQECEDCDVKYEIISFHPNKAETNYSEIKAQFMFGVLELRDQNDEYLYLNRNINMRYYRSENFKNHRVLTTEIYSEI